MSNFKIASGISIKDSSTKNNSEYSFIPTGMIFQTVGQYVANEGITNGRCLCDGRAISRTFFSDLFNSLLNSIRVFTTGTTAVTVSGANSIFSVNDEVYIKSTTTMPSGITSGTRYYIVSTTATSVTISATLGGTEITIGSSSALELTMYWTPYGLGDGSTTFNVPNIMNLSSTAAYIKNQSSYTYPLGQGTVYTGTNTHTHTGILKASGSTNATASTHSHTAPSSGANCSVPGSDHGHNLAINQNAHANPAGSRSRTNGASVSAGLAHTHSLNAPGTGGTTYSADHTHSIGNNRSVSYTQPTHSHAISTVGSSITTSSTTTDPQFMQMLYYIKL